MGRCSDCRCRGPAAAKSSEISKCARAGKKTTTKHAYTHTERERERRMEDGFSVAASAFALTTDFIASLDRWKGLSREGMTAAGEMCNTGIMASHLGMSLGENALLKSESDSGRDDDHRGTSMQNLALEKLRRKFRVQRKRFQAVCTALWECLDAMNDVVRNLQYAKNAAIHALGAKQVATTPVLCSQTYEDVIRLAREIIAMHTRDAALKASIAKDVENLAIDANTDRQDMLLELSAWSSMPYIDEARLAIVKKMWTHELSSTADNIISK